MLEGESMVYALGASIGPRLKRPVKLKVARTCTAPGVIVEASAWRSESQAREARDASKKERKKMLTVVRGVQTAMTRGGAYLQVSLISAYDESVASPVVHPESDGGSPEPLQERVLRLRVCLVVVVGCCWGWLGVAPLVGAVCQHTSAHAT